ncbi:MAG: ribulose-phosphate 3-epimerase [Erysipelotrichaceae bacterium]|nr:ribulose-phosphate 3-epimerase [Erysipelotrichaceae bacterium]
MIIAPSVLSLDYTRFNEQVDILNKRVEWIHFDVMDGHFVPNLTFGPDILKAFRRSSDLFMDAHLMVTDPSFFADVFMKAGADQITFHYEAVEEDKIPELIDKIHAGGCKAGISIKPKTEVKVLEPFLKDVDLVLVMSVEPGFGGQSFIEDSYNKIRELDKLRKEKDLAYKIQVDGGVNSANAGKLVASGVDVLVAGSFVFKGDMEANIQSLYDAEKK